jgi:hypothetical protein
MKMEMAKQNPIHPSAGKYKAMIVIHLQSFCFLNVAAKHTSAAHLSGNNPCKHMVFMALQKKILPAAY